MASIASTTREPAEFQAFHSIHTEGCNYLLKLQNSTFAWIRHVDALIKGVELYEAAATDKTTESIDAMKVWTVAMGKIVAQENLHKN